TWYICKILYLQRRFCCRIQGRYYNDAESRGRRRLYHPSCAAFIVDASREDGSLDDLSTMSIDIQTVG
ncbi:hypothetical protein FQN60_013259, partial [Etheostoma spectabile]